MDNFLCCIPYVLNKEKYFSNDPDDPGRLTIWGFASKYWPNEVEQMRNMSREDAKEFAINLYRTHFWNNVGLNLLTNKSLSCKVFSLGVLLNPKKSVKLLQQACNDIGAILSIDGVIGINSATWINNYKYPQAIEESFESLATAELKKKGKSKYIAGWLIRVDESAIG